MYYAAFGIFTSRATMDSTCKDARLVGVGRVHGWRFAWRGCADTEQDDDSVLEVLVWDISTTHLRALDRVEGYPFHYDRVTVPVELMDGTLVEAQMYSMVHKGPYSVPFGGMLNAVHGGHLSNGMDDTQIQRAIDLAREAGDEY